MTVLANDTILTDLVITGVPEQECVEGGFPNLLKAIQKYMAVNVPASVSNVVISQQQPGEDQRNSLWFRRNNAGLFIGVFIFSLGKWVQIYPIPQGVFWMYGDSRYIPEGYALINSANAKIPSSVRDRIMADYVYDQTNTYYLYFATTFEGN